MQIKTSKALKKNGVWHTPARKLNGQLTSIPSGVYETIEAVDIPNRHPRKWDNGLVVEHEGTKYIVPGIECEVVK